MRIFLTILSLLLLFITSVSAESLKSEIETTENEKNIDIAADQNPEDVNIIADENTEKDSIRWTTNTKSKLSPAQLFEQELLSRGKKKKNKIRKTSTNRGGTTKRGKKTSSRKKSASKKGMPSVASGMFVK